MQRVEWPDGGSVPALGLGTWRMGELATERALEVGALRSAIDLGYRLFDTAEMYGEGGAESVLGEAVAQALRAGAVQREALTIVSKVYPHNASRAGVVAACERSLHRLGLDQIDVYLLHWRGEHPLRETVDGLQALVAAGKVRRWGVSNFDTDDMRALELLGGIGPGACATNQIYYSLSARGPEFSLLRWMRERRLPAMAYCPIDQGQLATDRLLADIGAPHGWTAAQVALAWVLAQHGVIAIPKAVSLAHLRENWAAADIRLSDEETRRIEAQFRPPKRKTPLAMI
jgi:diketogulonate reductase-like aldo/keto reductase